MEKLSNKYSNEEIIEFYLDCAKTFLDSVKTFYTQSQYRFYNAAIEDFINTISGEDYDLINYKINNDLNSQIEIDKDDVKKLAFTVKEKYMENIYLKQKTSPKRSIFGNKRNATQFNRFYFSNRDVFSCIDNFLMETVNKYGTQIDINELTYALTLFKHNNLGKEREF